MKNFGFFRISVLLTKVSLPLLLTFLSISVFSQSGLQFSPEEIAIWRQRAGLASGKAMYNTTGDVSSNSPGDWSRILTDAKSCVNNPANDRFNNYDISRGKESPITELNSPWVPDNYWPARIPYIDAKEPRPDIGGKDYAAISVMNAGFVYLLAGDDNQMVGGIQAKDYAKAVRDELIWYAKNEWLDFSNSKRWVPSSSGGFNDRNPGFFIACWLNSMLNAYDYTKSSSAYTANDRKDIEKWVYDAMVFYHSLMRSVMNSPFSDYENGDYGSVRTGGWNEKHLGAAWEGSAYRSYGFNEFFANRSAVNWRFVSRAALFLKDHAIYNNKAKEIISDAHRWFKEWVVYGTFADGTHIDFHRSKVADPQKGLQYATIAIGAVVDFADTYERVMHNEPSFESFYAWKVSAGSNAYNKYFPAKTKDRPWRKSLEFTSGEKGLETVLNTLFKHFDGSFGSSRKWGNYPIDGHSYPSEAFVKIVESERWLSLANLYYKNANWTKIYTRTKAGTVGYNSSPTKAGSYDINIGAWASHPGTLFMFGQMEGKVWPYSSEEEPDPEVPVASFLEAEDHFIVLADVGTLGNVASVGENNALLSSNKGVKMYDRGDKIRIPFAVEESGTYTLNLRLRVGDSEDPQNYLPSGYKIQLNGQSVAYDVVTDISDKDNAFGIAYWGTLQFKGLTLEAGSHKLDIETYRSWGLVDFLEIKGSGTTPDNFTFEAEDIYEPITNVGDNGNTSVAEETSPLLSNGKAVKLYDPGDVIDLVIKGVRAGKYSLRLRVRSGDRNNKSAYFSNGYQVKVNGVESAFIGDVESVSERDDNFGIAHWGDLVSEQPLTLLEGENSIEIKALKNWCLVDKLELIVNPHTKMINSVAMYTQKQFKLYPVPAKGHLTIQKQRKEDIVDDLAIYSLLGTLVYRSTENFDISKTIRTDNLTQGNYIIVLRVNDQIVVEKFVVE